MRILLAFVLATLVVGGAVTLSLVLDEDEAGPVAFMGPANGARSTQTDRGVQEFEFDDYSHTPDAVDYEQSPPAGGRHDQEWLECGVYDRPVRNENAVHALEHGTVWITHHPDLGEEDVQSLAGLLPDEGILSPYADQEAPVVITVWGRQLSLDGVDVDQLQGFIDQFGNSETAPEPMASCHGGVTRYADGDAT